MAVVHIEKAAAEEALRAAAFEHEDRLLVHCFAGTIGADWDLEAALAAVNQATEIAWATNLFDHDLAIRMPDGLVRRFSVEAPEGVL